MILDTEEHKEVATLILISNGKDFYRIRRIVLQGKVVYIYYNQHEILSTTLSHWNNIYDKQSKKDFEEKILRKKDNVPKDYRQAYEKCIQLIKEKYVFVVIGETEPWMYDYNIVEAYRNKEDAKEHVRLASKHIGEEINPYDPNMTEDTIKYNYVKMDVKNKLVEPYE